MDNVEKKDSKVKDALGRDWEQTKHDFSKKRGEELDQNLGDTLKQASGKEPIPPDGVPNLKISTPKHEKGGVAVPMLMWIAGVPLGLVFLAWLFFFRGH